MKERPIIFSGDMVRAILAGRKTQTRRVVKPQPVAIRHDAAGWELCRTDDHRPLYPETFARSYCPFGQPGDRLWVRETCWFRKSDGITAFADGTLVTHPTSLRGAKPIWPDKPPEDDWPANAASFAFAKRSPIHMPRWASRLTLEIVSVRVERLQEIRAADCRAEGCEPDWDAFHDATDGMEGWEEPEDYIEECEEEMDWVNYGRRLVHSSEHKEWLADRERYALRLAFRSAWDQLNAKRGHPWERNPWVWAVEFKKV